MLALKSFIHESIKSLDNDQLALVSDTLRLDVRGYDTRSDLHRALAALLCLDKDTSLGVFVSWLQTLQQDKFHASTASKSTTNGFANTFVPTLSPILFHNDTERFQLTTSSSPKTKATVITNQVKEHHLEEEIHKRLLEIGELEKLFKDAERGVHKGAPSFEKLKKFLVQLTLLRSKEEEARQFLVQRNQFLAQENAKLQEEVVKTHDQLEFFVQGFANLRKRHDAIIEQAAQTQAMNQVLENVLLAMQGNDAVLVLELRQLLTRQVQGTERLEQQLTQAHEQINGLQKKVDEAKKRLLDAQNHRDDFRKDATCLRFQMRKIKRKMKTLQTHELKMKLFEFQLRQIRTSLSNLLVLLGDSIARDVKAAKPSGVGREFLKMIKTLSVTTLDFDMNRSEDENALTSGMGPSSANDLMAPPLEEDLTVIQKPRNLQVDELFKSLVLLGGKDSDEAEACALLLSEKMHFVAFDVLSFVHHTIEPLSPPPVVETVGSSDTEAMEVNSLVLPAEICAYLPMLVDQVRGSLKREDANGFILYNWEFSRKEIVTLAALGMRIDAILELHCPPVPISTDAGADSSSPSSKGSSNSPSRVAKPGARSKSPQVKAPAFKSPTRSNAAVSPKKAATTTTTTTTTTSKNRGATTTTPNNTDKRNGKGGTQQGKAIKASVVRPTIDRAKVFGGMHHVFRSIAFALAPEERVDKIFDALEQQKASRLVPVVTFQNQTLASEHERFAMWAEELEMRMVLGEEKHKPKKATTNTTTSSNPGSVVGTNSSTPASPTTVASPKTTTTSPAGSKNKRSSLVEGRKGAGAAGAVRATLGSKSPSRLASASKSPRRQGSPNSRGSSTGTSSSRNSTRSTSRDSRSSSPAKATPKSPPRSSPRSPPKSRPNSPPKTPQKSPPNSPRKSPPKRVGSLL